MKNMIFSWSAKYIRVNETGTDWIFTSRSPEWFSQATSPLQCHKRNIGYTGIFLHHDRIFINDFPFSVKREKCFAVDNITILFKREKNQRWIGVSLFQRVLKFFFSMEGAMKSGQRKRYVWSRVFPSWMRNDFLQNVRIVDQKKSKPENRIQNTAPKLVTTIFL